MFEDILGEKIQNIVEVKCGYCLFVIAWQLLEEGENKIEWPECCPNCDAVAERVLVESKRV